MRKENTDPREQNKKLRKENELLKEKLDLIESQIESMQENTKAADVESTGTPNETGKKVQPYNFHVT